MERNTLEVGATQETDADTLLEDWFESGYEVEEIISIVKCYFEDNPQLGGEAFNLLRIFLGYNPRVNEEDLREQVSELLDTYMD